ncbi:MAG TPA: sigma 54-interacting transcriptional regulator [Polyangiaceae bacterium]|jgi:DNA-binding NtrC family response regulator|nr:sigma 54-interacting transcriptional regulator [Polyangiaceae bacterium]
MMLPETLTKRRSLKQGLVLDTVPGQLSQHRLRLSVVIGPDQGAECDVLAARASVGSAGSNDLCLTDDTVSRHHCEVVARGDCYVVRDLGSTNGTFVDGVRVFEAPIEPGMRLCLGDSEVIFEPSHTWVPLGESESDRFGELYGSSPVMRGVFALLEKVSSVALTCLIVGETGTGKEIAARGIHQAGSRANAPFVILDCGAVNENLVEAELFGHERGAFTGADRSRSGAFERAHGGTIFLDEIGELPLELQPKLLRVLERKEVTPIGAGAPTEVDVRVIAATHRDLAAMVDDGTFREDLLYRLAEVVVRMPPLREHREDVPMLAGLILDRLDGPPRSLGTDAVAYLKEQGWPGNVRELRNIVRRAAALSNSLVLRRGSFEKLEQVRPSNRPAAPVGQPAVPTNHDGLSLRDARQAVEREYLAGLLGAYEDLDRAADHAGIHRKSLERLMRRHGLSRR